MEVKNIVSKFMDINSTGITVDYLPKFKGNYIDHVIMYQYWKGLALPGRRMLIYTRIKHISHFILWNLNDYTHQTILEINLNLNEWLLLPGERVACGFRNGETHILNLQNPAGKHVSFPAGKEEHKKWQNVNGVHQQTPTSYIYLSGDRLLCGFENGMSALVNLSGRKGRKLFRKSNSKKSIKNLTYLSDTTFLFYGFHGIGIIDIEKEMYFYANKADIALSITSTVVMIGDLNKNVISMVDFSKKRTREVFNFGKGKLKKYSDEKFIFLHLEELRDNYETKRAFINIYDIEKETLSEYIITDLPKTANKYDIFVLPEGKVILTIDNQFYLIELGVSDELAGVFEIQDDRLIIYENKPENHSDGYMRQNIMRSRDINLESLTTYSEKVEINDVMILDDGMIAMTLYNDNGIFLWD